MVLCTEFSCVNSFLENMHSVGSVDPTYFFLVFEVPRFLLLTTRRARRLAASPRELRLES